MIMKNKILFIVLASILFSTAAAAKPANVVQVEPVVATSLPPICETIGEIYAVDCKKNPILKSLGCDDIQPPPEDWGGLKPYLPMAICKHYKKSGGDYIRNSGCSVPVGEQYIVLTGTEGKYQAKLIKSPEEFKKYFAPIETPAEAVSYISALTGAYPVYEFAEKYFIRTMEEDGEYVGKMKPTEVKEKKDKFIVNLFDHMRCGCHRPELYEIEYEVTRDGYITQKKKKAVWQANRLYKICID